MNRVRAFFAVEIPRDLRGMIAGFAKKLPVENVKWVGADQIHVTMRFLGEVDRAALPAIVRSVQEELRGFDAFEMQPHGFSVFPTRGKPRVFYVGIRDGREELCELALRIERGLANHGLREENRAFTPHITVGRAREERRPRVFAGGVDQRPVLAPPEPRAVAPEPPVEPPKPFVPQEHRFIGHTVWVPGVTLFESRLPEPGDERRDPEYIPLARIEFHASR